MKLISMKVWYRGKKPNSWPIYLKKQIIKIIINSMIY